MRPDTPLHRYGSATPHSIARNGPIFVAFAGLFFGGASSAATAPADRRVVAQTQAAAPSSDAASAKQRRNDRGEWADPVTAAPAGTQYRTCFSQTINVQYSYLVYLPPGYDANATARYPVIYWLHGSGSNQRRGGGMVQILDQAIRAKQVPLIPRCAMLHALLDKHEIAHEFDPRPEVKVHNYGALYEALGARDIGFFANAFPKKSGE